MAKHVPNRFNPLLAFVTATIIACGTTGTMAASCSGAAPGATGAAAPSQDVIEFQQAPAAVFSSTTDAASGEQKIQSIAVADTGTVDQILKLLPTASKDAKGWIGRGLAGAVLKCEAFNPLEAFAIQKAVSTQGDPEVLASFLQGLDDIQFTDIGPGPTPATAATGPDVGGQNKSTLPALYGASKSQTSSSPSPTFFTKTATVLFTRGGTTSGASTSKSP